MTDATAHDPADALAWLEAGEQYKAVARAYGLTAGCLKSRARRAGISRFKPLLCSSSLEALIWTMRAVGLSYDAIALRLGHTVGHLCVVVCQVRKRFGISGRRQRRSPTPRQHQAYDLHLIGLNRHQIAGRMGVSVKTVDSMLCKARKGFAAREATA